MAWISSENVHGSLRQTETDRDKQRDKQRDRHKYTNFCGTCFATIG
jgi:hypothetical protein